MPCPPSFAQVYRNSWGARIMFIFLGRTVLANEFQQYIQCSIFQRVACNFMRIMAFVQSIGRDLQKYVGLGPISLAKAALLLFLLLPPTLNIPSGKSNRLLIDPTILNRKAFPLVCLLSKAMDDPHSTLALGGEGSVTEASYFDRLIANQKECMNAPPLISLCHLRQGGATLKKAENPINKYKALFPLPFFWAHANPANYLRTTLCTGTRLA